MGNLFDALRDEEDNISEHAYWRNYQRGEKRGAIVAEYHYLDADDEFYLRVERTEDKQFPQSRLNVSAMCIWRWQRDPSLNFPQPTRINNIDYTDMNEIDAWMRARVVSRIKNNL
jgi:hypothetical protein